jgi:predicted O-methyltransferase YrrM
MTETVYDRVAYPSAIVRVAHPDRLALIARLHGLSPPPPQSARVLEIGGGDGANVLSLAAALPDAQFLSFDLAPSAVARGQAMADRAGLTNVTLETLDILDATKRFARESYDYIIAHGVYAWVPDHVRAATMALIGHALSPDGVAFVSYNALPGGHIRQIMREMLLHALRGVEGEMPRIEAAHTFLTDYGIDRADDDAVVRTLRLQARLMLERPPEVLFHDELGGMFAPQSLEAVAGAGAAVGLRFLGDAGSNRTLNGFWDEGMSEAQGLAREQAADYAGATFFRQTMFVRAHHLPARQLQLDVVDTLFASGEFKPLADGAIKSGESEFTLRDEVLTAHLRAIDAAAPAYVPVASLGLDRDQREAFVQLFDLDLLQLRTTPGAFALQAGDRPCASPLARAHLAEGQQRVVRLDHSVMMIDEPSAKTLIEHLDGTRDRAALEALWSTLDHRPGLTLDGALAMLAGARLLIA